MTHLWRLCRFIYHDAVSSCVCVGCGGRSGFCDASGGWFLQYASQSSHGQVARGSGVRLLVSMMAPSKTKSPLPMRAAGNHGHLFLPARQADRRTRRFLLRGLQRTAGWGVVGQHPENASRPGDTRRQGQCRCHERNSLPDFSVTGRVNRGCPSFGVLGRGDGLESARKIEEF